MSVAVAERPEVAMQLNLRPVISFHGVSKVYPTGTVALRDVELAVLRKGQVEQDAEPRLVAEQLEDVGKVADRLLTQSRRGGA